MRTTEHYIQFITYLRSRNLLLAKASVGHTLKDSTTKDPLESYTVKLTKDTTALVRNFMPK